VESLILQPVRNLILAVCDTEWIEGWTVPGPSNYLRLKGKDGLELVSREPATGNILRAFPYGAKGGAQLVIGSCGGLGRVF